MTRGTLFYYEDDEHVYSSTEYNGDMYHGTPDSPQGMGDEVIKLMANLESLDDFKTVLAEINHHYKYEEGNDCWLVSDEAIAEDNKKAIEWIEKDRPDLKGNKDFDPRAMERVPTFKDVRTWKFWGTPNLSDYSYIYNNSGKDLLITTNSQTPGMIIPDGSVGVLNYGSNDSIFKDGKLIDGMGNYEMSETEGKAETQMLSKPGFYEYILENFTLDRTSKMLVKNIINYVETRSALTELLDGIGLKDEEIERVEL